jgi:serine/threonine protein kinase
MVMSLFRDEFAEKSVKKYISEGLWLDCGLSDDYNYVDYYTEGGYGTIYLVIDKKTGEELILKRSLKKDFVEGRLESPLSLNLSTENMKGLIIDPNLRISKEAEFMGKVYDKLGGLKLHAYYDDDDHYILIMDNGGRSLEEVTTSHKKKITDLIRYEAYKTNFFYQTYLNQIKKYMIKVYHKIKDIHELGIHHNDLKPENILLDEEKITIIDFGVAKQIDSKVDFTSFKGTLEYIPYEYVENGSYKAWDHTVWCFGIMLHFLTLMRFPFLKEEDVIEYNLNNKNIEKLPQSFSNLIYDCLQKDPSQRPRNLLERLENLEI